MLSRVRAASPGSAPACETRPRSVRAGGLAPFGDRVDLVHPAAHLPQLRRFRKKACCSASAARTSAWNGSSPAGTLVVLARGEPARRVPVAVQGAPDPARLLERLQQDQLRLRGPQDAGVGRLT